MRTALLVCVAALAVLPYSSALVARPNSLPSSSKSRNTGATLRLRGGSAQQGLSTELITKISIAADLLQGSAMALAPETTMKAYGMDSDFIDALQKSIFSTWGFSGVGSGLFIGLISTGTPYNQAVGYTFYCNTVALLYGLVVHIAKMGVSSVPTMIWAVLMSIFSTLCVTDGAGVVDPALLIKGFCSFGILNVMLGFLFPKSIFKLYGQDAPQEKHYRMVRFQLMGWLAQILLIILWQESPAKALMASWGSFSLLFSYSVYKQDWRVLGYPNGVPVLVWAITGWVLASNALNNM
jgi:hypothetical protein